VALLLFPTCADVHGVKEKPRGVPWLRICCGRNYTVRTATGEALAISIPRIEAAVVKHFQEGMPYGLFVPDEAK
jgi:hypothetical protein